MNASPESVPDPLAALPVLREAGVSVYWEHLDGRTAWVADPATREVWLSRAIPPSALLRYFVEALQALDDGSGAEPARGITLVHSTTEVEHPSPARAELRIARS
ncbi:hypothetical protein [Actinomycetospora termitidis]|uniref:Uncharacterized protein n=1 Tax=Actinomycetospora termitidis TaxID=3053470 RepID=A0ABT7MI48_9PSEU|nr:hypothetical protein [Actinomycetospora sp. Odt1-22]MDL5160356.1 hypothetical protein [Actinomycetospora sp. Odt1-22]